MVSLADKNEYLKKYLSPAETDKKKKKKPKKSHGSGFNIEEDDAFAKVSVGASSSALQRYLDGEASDPDSENDMVITGVTKSGAFLASSFQTVGDEVQNNGSSSFKSIKIEAPDSGDEQVAETTREDLSPPRRRRHDSNEKPRDLSPPRRRRHDSNEKPRDSSPPRRRRHDSNEKPRDSSPPRRRRHDSSERTIKREVRDSSPPRKQRRHDSNDKTDRSPPRRRRHDSNDKTDRSPPRRRQRHDSNDKQITIKQEPNDSSPPRRRHDSSNEEVAKKQKSPEPSPPQQRRRRHDSDRSITPPPTRPQYGRAASPSQNQAVLRRKRITKEQEARTAREAKKQQELDEKYAAVSKGVAQDEQRQQKIKEMEQTVEENFTRYADDEAMNTRLKGQLLGEDDPMNEYMSKKVMKIRMKSELVYPSYRGQFPQNRYEIPPGYRWDGVDRSNGFEKKMGAVANRKIAENSAAYRTVTEMAE